MQKAKYMTVRGVKNFSAAETILLNRIVDKAKSIFSLYGYQEIILPILEEEGLFIRGLGKTTDIVEKQIFKIKAENKNIVLRPEATAQVVRYYLENNLNKSSDLYRFSYFGPMFRGERPQKGRLRQFHHIGCEAIGSDSFYLDAEVIILAYKILESFGIGNFTLKINSLGCKKDKAKLAEIIKEGLKAHKNRLCSACQRRFNTNILRILDCKNPQCRQVVSSLELKGWHLCNDCKEKFSKLLSLLKKLNIPYFYDYLLVRGLDYYTNTVFEFSSTSLGSQDAIAAGGRYNNLIEELGGLPTPAIGFAIGVERVLLLQNTNFNFPAVDVFLAFTNNELLEEAFLLAEKLKKKGISCCLNFNKKSLKSQLKYSQKLNAPFTLILGEDELKEGCIILRNMRKSTQEKIKLTQIEKKINNVKDT